MNELLQGIFIFLAGGLILGSIGQVFTVTHYKNKLSREKQAKQDIGDHLDDIREKYREYIERLQKRITKLETPPEPETILTNFQQSKDEFIARRLMELGKVPDCTCEIEFEARADRLNVSLDYEIDCPVHYPHTSKFLGKWYRN